MKKSGGQFDSDDYYVVLGVKKPDDQKTIKKAYHKLSLKWHPDRNPNNVTEATEVFKKIGEAYAVLSDERKRQTYDLHGKEGLNPSAGGPPGGRSQGFSHQSFNFGPGMGGGGFSSHSGGFSFNDANDVFKKFFNGKDPFEDFFDMDNGFGGGHRGMMDDFGRGGHGMDMGFGGGGFMDMGGFGDQRPKQKKQQKKQTQQMQRQDPFGDPFGGFGGGFGGMMDMDMDMGGFGGGFSSQTMSMGGGMGGGTSVKTSTVIENGRKITRTEKTTIDQNGQKQTQVTEKTQDANGNVNQQSYMLDGGSNNRKKQVKGKY